MAYFPQSFYSFIFHVVFDNKSDIEEKVNKIPLESKSPIPETEDSSDPPTRVEGIDNPKSFGDTIKDDLNIFYIY